MPVKTVITGASGQLGCELQRTATTGFDCMPLGRDDLDICDVEAVRAALAINRPELLINAAAYTAVDLAETEPEQAQKINATGAANLARACSESGIRLIHVSTDFVFDGRSSAPYLPESTTAPLGEYGRSKLAGEQAIEQCYPGSLIVRTAWVYSSFGGNFVKTMLRLMAERQQLSVVADQIGTPTWARGLAQALWKFALRPDLKGIYHWTDAGVCSWYDFAVAIAEEAVTAGLLASEPAVLPIPAADYPTPAARPAFSVLDKSKSWTDLGVEGVHWRRQLRAMLQELMEQEIE